jgi:hypothetical protein
MNEKKAKLKMDEKAKFNNPYLYSIQEHVLRNPGKLRIRSFPGIRSFSATTKEQSVRQTIRNF